jgi:hypothetical protein
MSNEQIVRQHIDDIFDQYTLHFLAYQGGSGGEFLISKIQQYSEIYNTNTTSTTVESTNRTILQMNHFLSIIYFSRLHTGNLNDIKDLIFTELSRIANGNVDSIISMIDSTKSIIVPNKANLCKLHLTSNSYFNKENTWSIYIDNKESFEYVCKLRYLKVFKNKWEIPSIVDNYKINFWQLGDKLDLLDKFSACTQHRCITEIEEIYVACMFIDHVFHDFDSIDDLLLVPADELYLRYSKDLDDTYENRKDFLNDSTVATNRIHYSKIFEAGYLEDMFKITDSNFRRDLLEWHNKNMDNVSLLDKKSYSFISSSPTYSFQSV